MEKQPLAASNVRIPVRTGVISMSVDMQARVVGTVKIMLIVLTCQGRSRLCLVMDSVKGQDPVEAAPFQHTTRLQVSCIVLDKARVDQAAGCCLFSTLSTAREISLFATPNGLDAKNNKTFVYN
jgi:hypothetical protein